MCAVAKQAGEGRAGSRVLSLFANPLHAEVLRVHARGPQRVSKLPEEIGWSAPTTLRAAVATLSEAGALDKVTSGTSYAVENRLTPAGEEMLFVAEVLEAWLADAPDGPIPLDSKAARAAIKALAGGWSSTLVHALAAGSYSLTQLARLIPDASYASLGRHLGRMRVTRQVARERGEGRSTPYVATDWLRRSIAPLCAAGRCEHRHMQDAAPITDIEVEASFLMSLPLVSLPGTANGTCVLAVHTGAGEQRQTQEGLAGVTVAIARGQVTACEVGVGDQPPTWALGTPEAWLDGVIDGNFEELRFGGVNPRLALVLVKSVHLALFGARKRAR
jgi:DNA-binding HxlR family transcriptional regulator